MDPDQLASSEDQDLQFLVVGIEKNMPIVEKAIHCNSQIFTRVLFLRNLVL